MLSLRPRSDVAGERAIPVPPVPELPEDGLVMAAPNPHEQAARDRKIFAIIAKLDQINRGPVHYEETSKLTEKEWGSIAKLAGVNRPSAKTVAEILAILQARAAR